MSTIYRGEPVKGKAQAAARNNFSTALGSSLVLRPADSVTKFPEPAAQWLVDGDVGVAVPRRLLTVVGSQHSEKLNSGGSWIVTLKAEGTLSATKNVTSSVVAVVSYGTGGVSSSFEVDANRGLFSVPADDFTVDVGFRRPGTSINLGTYPEKVAEETKVVGTVHRGTGVRSSPMCSYYLLPLSTNGANLIQTRVPIPPQAIGFKVSSEEIIPAGSVVSVLGGALLTLTGGQGSTIALDKVDNDQFLSMVRTGCLRPVAPWMKELAISYDGTVLVDRPRFFMVSFLLGL